MAKEFTDFYKWNPVILRLELEMAKAKRMAILDKYPENYKPLDETFKRFGTTAKDTEKYLLIDGEIPTVIDLGYIRACIAMIASDNCAMCQDNDFFLYGFFLAESGALHIDSVIDQIKANAAEKCKKTHDSYCEYLYKRLYALRSRVYNTFIDWTNINLKHRGFHCMTKNKLRSMTMKNLEQDTRDHTAEEWHRIIYDREYPSSSRPAPVKPKKENVMP